MPCSLSRLACRHTWFDRELSVAGRVLLRVPGLDGTPDTFEHRVLRVEQPILRIPNLAIHLRTAEEKDAFKVNKHGYKLMRAFLQHFGAIDDALRVDGVPLPTTTDATTRVADTAPSMVAEEDPSGDSIV